MNNLFKEHVRSAAFHLSLSKRMIAHLMGIYYADNRSPDSHFVASKNALQERGLLLFFSAEHYHIMFPELRVEMRSWGRVIWKDNRTGYATGERPIYKLTEEGVLVARLCEKAGFDKGWYDSNIDPRWNIQSSQHLEETR